MQSFAIQHQHRIEAALAKGEAARSALAASWARSALLHGLDPARGRTDARVSQEEMRIARDRHRPLLRAAAPHLDHLIQVVGDLGACVVLADTDGLALDRRGHPRHDDDFRAAGLWTGANWSEAVVGTNGIGTCLAEGKAVTIHRDQHFLVGNTALTCSSAPVHDAAGNLTAVVDVSMSVSRLPDAVVALIAQTVAEAAHRVEADIFRAAFPKARIVLVPRPDGASGGFLAVDVDDLVIGATRAARLTLGLSGDPAILPQPLNDLLDIAMHDRIEDAERAVLTRALARNAGNISAAARALGVSRATLHRKLARG
ncbi:helix-turn-helix domain-containing protein [Roseinatronobacter alkalisoli]|uniref:Helix-turn-helix domain-containing protein n=1 Tax=Roseinatronobacter alkalisoli TaxID=3028235 RepID=A0ABT5T9P1_9RHOB|nr:helix-turn-helix domain-containing protein [Roseinatronobacter sp. HJB301]MDD7971832.1 helix-turn-helix domain-containing protein [Roseinatronobacter sp. HJB301]